MSLPKIEIISKISPTLTLLVAIATIAKQSIKDSKKTEKPKKL